MHPTCSLPIVSRLIVLSAVYILCTPSNVRADDVVSEATPGPMEIITAADEETGYSIRYRAVRQLGQNLSPGELHSALEFLARHPDDDPLPAQALNAVKNNLTIALINQMHPPRQIGNLLVEHFRNESMDDGWRDYCLQLLVTWYPKTHRQEQNAIIDFYLEVTGTRDATFAGTALISLKALAHDHTAIDSDIVAARAYSIVADEQQTFANRAAALHVGADLEQANILEIARTLSRSPDQNVLLHMAAVAVIGTLGDESDYPHLRSLSESPDMRLRGAAHASLERLR